MLQFIVTRPLKFYTQHQHFLAKTIKLNLMFLVFKEKKGRPHRTDVRQMAQQLQQHQSRS